MAVSIKYLRELTLEYQALLGLTEWKFEVDWGKPVAEGKEPRIGKKEMNRDCEGNAWWFTEDSRAVILLNRSCKALEETLVHEMLHVLLEGHRVGPVAYNSMYERALNKLAKALVGAA